MARRVSRSSVEKKVYSAIRKRTFSAIIIAAFAIGSFFYQEQLTGEKNAPAEQSKIAAYSVKIHDGDTITLNHQKIRLQGIDAPELAQKCTIREQWDCGKASKEYLVKLIGESEVSCTSEGKDKYNRMIGYCHVGDLDLNREMVRNGYAIAYRYYTEKYADDENYAKANSLGIWQGTFEEPWKWRKAAQKTWK